MKEKVTPYLKQLSGSSAIHRQYYAGECEPASEPYNDPLLEDSHEVVKGLVHKYTNRVLIKVSYQCAAHCRFCTRIRQIGTPAGTLCGEDIAAIVRYLDEHKEIDDVILSGGDPLYTYKLTIHLVNAIKNIDHIKVLRIGTRLPLQLPQTITDGSIDPLLDLVTSIASQRPFYILLHVNHPDELTDQALAAIKKIRSTGVSLLSQTVFLKNVNDEYEILYQLYTRLYHAGVMPYYLYHCDAVKGIEHFAGDITGETEIATRLAATLSGIACPTYILDVENGHGKIPLPLNFVSGDIVTDFKNTAHTIKW